MAKIVWFEIPADDMNRAKEFYETLFNWKIEYWEGSNEFAMITSEDNATPGGLMKRRHPEHQITDYIGVESIDSSINKVKELGGNILVQKTPVQGMGYFAVCTDTENNVFGLWEEDSNA